MRSSRHKARRSPLSEYLNAGEQPQSGSDSSSVAGGTDANIKNRKRGRLVKFDLSLTQTHKRTTPIDDKELNTRWYSSKELEKMKEKSFARAREYGKQDQVTRGNSNLHALLGKLLDACIKAKKQDTDKNLLKRKDFAKLVECLSNERVGLETAINTDLMADKLHRRYQVLRKVMGEQGNSPGGATIHDMVLSTPSKKGCSDEMARLSEKHSLASRQLARHLALAVAEAVY